MCFAVQLNTQNKENEIPVAEGYLERYPTAILVLSIFKYIPGDNTESQVSFSLSLLAWHQKILSMSKHRPCARDFDCKGDSEG